MRVFVRNVICQGLWNLNLQLLLLNKNKLFMQLNYSKGKGERGTAFTFLAYTVCFFRDLKEHNTAEKHLLSSYDGPGMVGYRRVPA